MAQFPDSAAARQPASARGGDDTEVIGVYDRLLPYAVLFGLQKQWSTALFGAYSHYQVAAPYWHPALLDNGAGSAESSLSSMLSSLRTAAGSSSAGAGSTGGGAAGGR